MSVRAGTAYRRRSEDPQRIEVTTFQEAQNRARTQSVRSKTIRPPSHISPPKPGSVHNKHVVQDPITVPQFFIHFTLHLCKQYVLFHPNFKAPLYLFVVFLGSSLGDLIRPQRKLYLARPGNFVTTWLVQRSHYWTFSLLAGFAVLTSYFYCGGSLKGIFRNVLRLLVGLCLYLVILSSFDIIQNFSAFCSNEDLRTENKCLAYGHKWLSFDISDDAFSLVFMCLLIMEELVVFSRWEELEFALKRAPMDVLIAPEQTAKNSEFAKTRYAALNGMVKVLFFALTILCLTWDVMLVVAVFFYQSLPQKLSGALIGIVCWLLTYRLWYPYAWPYLPGVGIVRNMRAKPHRK